MRLRGVSQFTKREGRDEHPMKAQVESGQMVEIYDGKANRTQHLISQGRHL